MSEFPSSSLEIVSSLVDGFSKNLNDYRKRTYLETPVRDDFIDPLFGALGWDMGNVNRMPEANREVVEEARIRLGIASGAPDYCFRLGGERCFFVEAKKPAEDIANDVRWALQIRRYAWNANVPIAVLTDFEELAIYDCRTEPASSDLVSTDRLKIYKFTELEQNWAEIWDLLSKPAVQAGSLRKYIDAPRPRGSATVDDSFLKVLTEWRVALASDIDKNNPGLSDRDLRYCVQAIIDRIVFLRMCEDRGIEPQDSLIKVTESPEIYASLFKIFHKADLRYNSGLFHFRAEPRRHQPDNLTPALSVSDNVLNDIINALYRRAFDFSIIPVETLGHAYEQFLGYEIVRSRNKISLQLKPELQKIGGVYYTPDHIVRWIVEQTVGRYLSGQKHSSPPTVRVLDPACGSGSFLLGAYKYLLDWHLAWYVQDGFEKHSKGRKPKLRASKVGGWHLTLGERKRILTSSIYGVDVDPQATEIAKLSLLLSVLEGESNETIATQLKLFEDRALPDLDNNIRWGNSLIGPDLYDQDSRTLFGFEDRLALAVFDWTHNFPELFDVVIGNPPYIDSEWMTKFHNPAVRPYCVRKYKAASGNWDIFCPFVERAVLETREGGYTAMIVPNKLGSADYAAGAREVLANDNTLIAIRDYSQVKVFPVAVYPIVFVCQRGRKPEAAPVVLDQMAMDPIRGLVVNNNISLKYNEYFDKKAKPWEIFGHNVGGDMLTRMRLAGDELKSEFEVVGAATVSEAYKIADIVRESSVARNELRLVNSGTIDPYECLWGLKDCRYLGNVYLRPTVQRGDLDAVSARRLAQARAPKIIISGMTKRLEAILDDRGCLLAGKSTTIVMPRKGKNTDLAFILAILNSDTISYYYDNAFGADKLSGGYLRIGPPQLSKIPIPAITTAEMASQQLEVIRLVGAINGRITALHSPASPHQLRLVREEFAALRRSIERLIQDLFGLTREDREIISLFAASLENRKKSGS